MKDYKTRIVSPDSFTASPKLSQVKFMAPVQTAIPAPPTMRGIAPNFVPKAVQAAALRAGREPIGMWPLMLWAYGKEMVRYTCGTDFRPSGFSESSMAWAIAAALSGIVGGKDTGSSLPTCCHDDALLVHGAVLKVIAAEREDGGADKGARGRQAFELLILQTEKRQAPPEWNPIEAIPDLYDPPRFLPVLRANGKPKCIADEFRHAIACLVRRVCYFEDEREVILSDSRRRYGEWIRLLDAVIHMLLPEHEKLKRWRLKGIGVGRTPWNDL